MNRLSELEAEKEQINQKYSEALAQSEKLTREYEGLLIENQNLEKELAELKKGETVPQAQELNTQKTKIFSISLDNTWLDETSVYTLKKAYLSDVLADVAESPDDDKSYILFEVNVVDTRSLGSAQIVPLSGYLKLVKGEMLYSTFFSDYHFISPGDDSTVFIGFFVDPGDTVFQFSLVGTQPATILNLDFSGNLSQELEGVLLSKSGYFPEYSQNALE